jgi:hypothetical protein
MRIGIIISVASLIIIACSNSNNHHKNDIPKNGFNAWNVLADTNFLVQWETATLKSIDSITPVLIKEASYSQETINIIKGNVINSKEEYVVKGRKVSGSHKWLFNKFSEYKDVLDTTASNSMFIIELTEEGEVTESIDWLVLFLNDNCRLVLTVDNSGVVHYQNKLINKQALENLIKEHHPSTLMTNKCLDKGEGLPMANLYISKFTENGIEVFPFPIFCSGFYEKFISVMQK